VIQSEETLLQFQAGNGGVFGMNIVSVTGSIAGGTSEVSFTPPINPLLINQALDLLDAVRINSTISATWPNWTSWWRVPKPPTPSLMLL
jgi:hypothetical protein